MREGRTIATDDTSADFIEAGPTFCAETWVWERVCEAFVEQLGVEPERLALETLLGEGLGADDLDIVELAMELEELFDITIADEAIMHLHTVGAWSNHVHLRWANPGM